MKREKVLFILHYSPPIHGASKVGDSIINSKIIHHNLNAKFIKIKSSQNIDQIGRFNFYKLFFLIELFTKTCVLLLRFRPKIIYYTASPQGFAFYRDLVITLPIKLYQSLTRANIFYHYHARGIQEFTGQSSIKLKLTDYFVKKVNLIFISKLLKYEVKHLNNYASLLFLPNMIKEKGYDVALDLAKHFNETSKKIHVDFAGAWASKEDESYFTDFVKSNNLEAYVTYHGLVQGEKKKKLFSEATVFIFPSSYKREVFPLAVLEALSYGLPVLTFDIGAVAKIIHEKVGVISNKERIFKDFKAIISDYKSESKYYLCREEYLKHYTIEVFEENLLRILKSKNA